MEFNRRQVLTTGHAIVNACGVVVFGALHLWGNLGASEAALGVLAICGFWWGNTKGGPPSGGPGVTGFVLGMADTMRQSVFPHH